MGSEKRGARQNDARPLIFCLQAFEIAQGFRPRDHSVAYRFCDLLQAGDAVARGIDAGDIRRTLFVGHDLIVSRFQPEFF